MAWADLFAGVAFYLILEGLFPFLAPRSWRRGVAQMSELNDGQLRTFGLVIVVMGLIVLYFVRN